MKELEWVESFTPLDQLKPDQICLAHPPPPEDMHQEEIWVSLRNGDAPAKILQYAGAPRPGPLLATYPALPEHIAAVPRIALPWHTQRCEAGQFIAVMAPDGVVMLDIPGRGEGATAIAEHLVELHNRALGITS